MDLPASGTTRALAACTGVLLVATALRFGATWELPAFVVLLVTLAVVSGVDVRRRVIPNRVVAPATGLSVLLLAVASAATGHVEPLLRALTCASGSFVVFTMLHLISPEHLGFGDAKLSILLGLDLGWLGFGHALLAAFLGFACAAIAGSVLLALHRRGRKDPIPFGPFLATGAVIAMLVGDAVVRWWRA